MTGSAMEDLAVIRKLDFDMAEEQDLVLSATTDLEEQLPTHGDWADTFKKVSKAAVSKKSKAQVARAAIDKAERTRKTLEAKLLKEAKLELASQGVTAADLLRESRREDAQNIAPVLGRSSRERRGEGAEGR